MLKPKMTAAWLILAFLAATGHADYVPCVAGVAGSLKSAAASPLTITLEVNDPRQTISSFGASDCWSVQFVGQWPDAKRKAIADLLFETGLDAQNQPRGIGLSLWRFNIGAGSSRQTNIYDEWRRAEVFYNGDFSAYNWNAQAGQRWFLQAAKARGCDQFLAFLCSPPINMTKNGFAFCDSSNGDTNLAADKYDDLAIFLADVMQHFQQVEGISFNYLSPVNEPQWDWNGTLDNGVLKNSQEGCRFSNANIKKLTGEIDAQLQSRGLNTKILLGEAGSIDYLYTNGSTVGNQIEQFFKPSSSNFLGDKLAPAISGHSYWTDWPSNGLITKRDAVRARCQQYGIDYIQSEYCILDEQGPGRDLGIDPALRIARTIHADLAVGNAVSWQWWLGISPHDYKDGLVYTDKNKANGNYYESKMLWVLGNYSRFVRPGMTRIDTGRSDGLTAAQTVEGLMVSGYHHAAEKVLVTVLVNYAAQGQAAVLSVAGLPAGHWVTETIPYVTRAADDLAPYARLQPNDVFEVPARSVVTLVTRYEPMPPGQVARWRLDGDLREEGGRFAGVADQPVFDQGVVEGGQALTVSGAGSRVTVADEGGALGFYPQGFTVSAWLKSDVRQWGALVAHQDRGSPWRGWVLTTNEDRAVFAVRQVHGDLLGGRPVKDNRWHQVAGVFDPRAGESRLYVDGVPDGRVETGGLLPQWHGQPLMLGAETAAGFSPFQGLIDDVRLFNYPMTDAQVAGLYQEVSGQPVCLVRPQFDPNGDCRTDLADLVMLSDRWLECYLFPRCE